MTCSLTRDLGAFVAGLTYEKIPPAALSVAHIGFADCVGVMIAGRDEPPARLLLDTLAPPPGTSTLLFGSRTASAPEAAWINGTAAHALDFDDVALRGHPSTVLVPAILAEAQSIGASGRQMLVAYVAGYETWAELVRRDLDQHHNKGWHPTGIFGAIGTAAACASLHGLNAEQAAAAIALGASQSAGIMANFGTMTKPFHAGRSAHAGVMSARLVASGFTAALDAFEHPQGFLAAVSPAGRLDLDSPVEAGEIWKLSKNKLSVKKYPLCFCTHRALDGMLDLLKETQIVAADVRLITVSTSRRNATILRNHLPQTGLEAKFSMEFAMASAVIARRAGLGELTDGFVRRDDVQALMKQVVVAPDDREDPNSPGYAPYDLVTVTLSDGGKSESRHITAVRGGADLPLSRDDLWTKFSDCVQVGGVDLSARNLFDALMSLEQITHVNRIPGLAIG
jgi:2-methylcitrate dehydratase PrpD